MKAIFVKLTAILSLFFISHLYSSGQKCQVTIIGNCEGDSLYAYSNGNNFNGLIWLWSNNSTPNFPIFNSSVETVVPQGGAAVYIDGGQNIYISDGYSSVEKWKPGANHSVTVAGGNRVGFYSSQLTLNEGIYVDRLGNIYVADSYASRIQKWSPGAKSGITVAGGNGRGSNANQLSYPYAVYVDDTGNIYIADKGNNRIQKWKPGATSGTTVAGGNGYGSAPNQLADPTSIYIDKSKNIYISDYSNNRIQKWKLRATTGSTVAGGNGQGNANNQLHNPVSVCLDTSGNMIIADEANDRVQKWSPGATGGVTVAAGYPFGETEGVFVDSLNKIYVLTSHSLYKCISHVANRQFLPYYPYNSGNYSVVATTAAGCTDTSNTVTIPKTAKIINIQGPNINLCGGGTFKYSAEFDSEDTANKIFFWIVPEGCEILSGQGTASIKLKLPSNFVKGELKVIGNFCTIGDFFKIEISTKPYISPISGFAYVKPGEKYLMYRVEPRPGLHYTWTVPKDATIVSGQGTQSIKVTWGASEGDVTVKSATCADTAIQRLHVVFINSTIHPNSHPCGKDSLKVSFKGKAPLPWAIDGSIKDWETLLGPSTGDRINPFYPPVTSAFNWAQDYTPGQDYDWPPPEHDINFTAFIHDDYNVYFYLRRLLNIDSANTFFYFCDINGDSYMNYGEPVFSATFTNDTISALTLSSYVPDTTKPKHYVKGKGNPMIATWVRDSYDSLCYTDPPHPCPRDGWIDAFPMRGGLKKIFQSDKIPDSNRLLKNEIFSAAVTEDGYGVELAIPWRYLKIWKQDSHFHKPLNPGDIFFYKESLQSGSGNYNPDSVKDNAGSCCKSVAKSGNVNVTKSVSVKVLIPDSLYRFTLSFTNTTNVAEGVQFSYGDVSYHRAPTDPQGKTPDYVAAYPDYNCNGIKDSGEKPVPYYTLKNTIVLPPYGTKCINVDIASHYHNHTPEGTFVFEHSVLFDIPLEPCDAAGGKVINPVGTVKAKIGTSGLNYTARPDSSDLNSIIKLLDNDVTVYPNPNAGSFKVYIQGGTGNNKLILYDVYGRIVQQLTSNNLSTVEMNSIQSGAYFLKVVFENGASVTKKVIVE